MKILLDENIPVRIKENFPNDYEVLTARDLNWNGKKNGVLLGLCVNSGFDLLITLDKNLQFQQNLNKFKIKIILLKVKNNRFKTIKDIIPKVLTILENGVDLQLTEVS